LGAQSNRWLGISVLVFIPLQCQHPHISVFLRFDDGHRTQSLLPSDKETVRPPQLQRHSFAAKVHPSSLRILLVDDSLAILKMIQEARSTSVYRQEWGPRADWRRCSDWPYSRAKTARRGWIWCLWTSRSV